MARFSQKSWEEDYNFLLALAQVVELVNLYSSLSSLDSSNYLKTKSGSKDSRTIKKKQAQEDLCKHDATALQTLHTIIKIFEPVMEQKQIQIGWHTLEERYVLVYKGRMLNLKAVEPDELKYNNTQENE